MLSEGGLPSSSSLGPRRSSAHDSPKQMHPGRLRWAQPGCDASMNEANYEIRSRPSVGVPSEPFAGAGSQSGACARSYSPAVCRRWGPVVQPSCSLMGEREPREGACSVIQERSGRLTSFADPGAGPLWSHRQGAAWPAPSDHQQGTSGLQPSASGTAGFQWQPQRELGDATFVGGEPYGAERKQLGNADPHELGRDIGWLHGSLRETAVVIIGAVSEHDTPVEADDRATSRTPSEQQRARGIAAPLRGLHHAISATHAGCSVYARAAVCHGIVALRLHARFDITRHLGRITTGRVVGSYAASCQQSTSQSRARPSMGRRLRVDVDGGDASPGRSNFHVAQPVVFSRVCCDERLRE